MAEYPKWKQDACELCRQGIPVYSNRSAIHHPSGAGRDTCTASSDRHIEQLTARVAELEGQASRSNQVIERTFDLLNETVASLLAENFRLRQPPANEAWRLIVEYAYKVGGEGVRHSRVHGARNRLHER